MPTNIQSLSARVQDDYNSIASSGNSRSPIMSIVIAKILADQENLPSSGVEDIRSYYNTTISIPVTQRLSKLNELLQLDIDTIQDNIYKFYCLRYSFMNPAKAVYCINSETVIEDFFGISTYLGQATLDILKKNPMLVTELYKRTSNLLNEILVDKPSSSISLGENYD
jgi:hypothetical protein